MKSENHLHLVSREGKRLSVPMKAAVEAAYRWAVKEFPDIDPALVAGWAEDVGSAMAARESVIESPRRYAFAALHGKVREWFRDGGKREFAVGIGVDLEEWAGIDRESQLRVERQALFEQLRTLLSERDQHILALLQQDMTSPASVAAALGVSYSAAAKAIQRVKERIAVILEDSAVESGPSSTVTIPKAER